eukprot:jgi/Mesvir1/17745/Mv05600-RA.1
MAEWLMAVLHGGARCAHSQVFACEHSGLWLSDTGKLSAGNGKMPIPRLLSVMIWDDHQSRCIGELSFRSEVRAVRLRRDRIVVVLEHKVYVYNFADLRLLQQIETVANPDGLCALSPASNSTVLACPGLHRGQVRIELYDLKRSRFAAAHDSPLSCIALSLDGSRLATASEKGTLIRIFDTADGQLLQELRRGTDRAHIDSIAFAPSDDWLAVSSNRGTVHVFGLKLGRSNGTSTVDDGRDGNGANGASTTAPVCRNTESSLSFMKGVLPKYFSSEWSFAQFRLPEETRCIVAFGPQRHTLSIVGMDGSFFKVSYDPVHGGECQQQSYTKFMRAEEEEDSS